MELFLATILTCQSEHSHSGSFQCLKVGRASLLPQLQSLGLCSDLLHGCRGCLNATHHSCYLSKGLCSAGQGLGVNPDQSF